jgi:hypothetical protein
MERPTGRPITKGHTTVMAAKIDPDPHSTGRPITKGRTTVMAAKIDPDPH